VVFVADCVGVVQCFLTVVLLIIIMSRSLCETDSCQDGFYTAMNVQLFLRLCFCVPVFCNGMKGHC